MLLLYVNIRVSISYFSSGRNGGYFKIRACSNQFNHLVILKDGPGDAVPLTQTLQIDNTIMNFCSKEIFYTSNILNITNAKWN